jgi:hypothetical protein
MTFKIEKEIKWNGNTMQSETRYFIWVGRECIALCTTEEEAREKYVIIKEKYVGNKSEILIEETVE